MRIGYVKLMSSTLFYLFLLLIYIYKCHFFTEEVLLTPTKSTRWHTCGSSAEFARSVVSIDTKLVDSNMDSQSCCRNKLLPKDMCKISLLILQTDLG